MLVKQLILFLLVGVMLGPILPGVQATSNSGENETSLVLRGRVKSVEIEEYDPQVAAFIRITVEAQFVNTGVEPILLLKRNPLFVEAALTKQQESFDRRHLLAVNGASPAISAAQEWISLRRRLDKSTPPLDETLVLKPKDSWTVEATVGVTVPIDPKHYTSSTKKEKLEVLQALSPVWLWVTCEIWPENVEGLIRNRDQLPFGHRLQKRWRSTGLLWLDYIRSEPIPLDLKTAMYKPKTSGKSSRP